MSTDETLSDLESTPDTEEEIASDSNETEAEKPSEEVIPVGIARIREEWRAAGLTEPEATPEVEPVVFPEVDGGAGIGDYTVDCETARDGLALSHEAIERLVASGELDSILVQGQGGAPRRLISESSLSRFREDAAIDPDALARAAKAMADKSVAAAIDELRAQIEDIKSNQSKVLQQMKDILLLEVRNLKEQERDLTSFVYELTEEIREALPKKKRK